MATPLKDNIWARMKVDETSQPLTAGIAYANKYLVLDANKGFTGIGISTMSLSSAGGDSAKLLSLEATVLAGTTGWRQGALNITMSRASDQALTAWDGNPDCGLKIQVNNRASNVGGAGGTRAIDVQARNRLVNTWVNTCEINGRNDSGATTTQLIPVHIRAENYGTVSTEIIGLDIELSSENDTGSPDKCGIRIRNTDLSGMTVVKSAIRMSNTSTNGFGALLDLTGLTAANGTIISTSGTVPTTFAGRIRFLDASGNPMWIPYYSSSNEA